MAAFQRFVEVIQFDNLPPGAIDQPHSRLHLGQGVGVDHVDGFFETRHMQRNEIGPGIKILVGHQFHIERLGRLRTHEGIRGDHFHAQPVGQRRHHASDMPQP